MHKELKILILTGVSPYLKSGILVRDMYKSLKQGGNEVCVLTKYYNKEEEEGIGSVFNKFETNIQRIKSAIRRLVTRKIKTDPNYYMISLNETKQYVSSKKLLRSIYTKPDLILYAFGHQFLNAKNLYEISKVLRVPILLFPIDMAPLTGGCHYFWECNGYKMNCGSCPGLFSKNKEDFTFRNILFKKKYIDKTPIYPIGGSWVRDKLRQSYLYSKRLSFEVNVVVNEVLFSDDSRHKARSSFDIVDGKTVIFFGALHLNEKRKGLDLLIKALLSLKESLTESELRNLVFIIAGANYQEILSILPFETVALGSLSPEQLPSAFKAADIYLSPSIEDAGPMMVTQSLMCGTPVVAFETGEATSLILDDVTGYIAKLYDVEGFKKGILSLIRKTKSEIEVIKKNCREVALKKSSYHAFNSQIISAYDNISSLDSIDRK
jgi:glycosyltransferase involved in cell wall biosynthesis